MIRMKRKAGISLATIAILAAGGFAACDNFGDSSASERPTAPTSADPKPSEPAPSQASSAGGDDSSAASSLYNDLSMNETQARTTLEALPVKKAASMAGYSQDDFRFWLSANAWGWEDIPNAKDCDAREAALARDGEDVESDADTCYANSGVWTDPYSGEEITDSSKVDIDHVVPRAAAHRAGADTWNDEQRTIFANSPLVVVASGATSNREKGDKGPEAWKPDNKGSWCAYSLRWIAIKNEFGLNLTSEAERAALEEMLDTCKQGSA